MAITYEPIATQTLGSTTTDVTLSSISSSYTDLILICNFSRVTANGQNLSLRVNSDTGSNYSNTYIEGDGSTAYSGRNSNQTSARIGAVGGGFTLSTTDLISVIINFNDYSNTTTNKTIISRYNQAGANTGSAVALWRSTSAISSITLSTFNTGQFGSGSTFTLYGIKEA